LKSEHWGVGFDFQLYLSNFILFFGSTGAWTQGLVLTRQVLLSL
jgi:hypothetical protein